MREKILCPVCEVSFLIKEEKAAGKPTICPVCGAILIMKESQGNWFLSRPAGMEPATEIRQRMDNFARLRGYHFNDMKDPLVEGLLKKRERFGDFYCPCKIDNIQENVCPCLETRMGSVERDGRCHCGLFWKKL
ncbi:MAG TPA: ferredoxin-thioredoxin reductase catalytic domain-containing protein [Atribacteraceae bacterium]|nr:ferredoxin-thioredoxin reductase catalytic domain-containing protein [Atribacteraceae bacterium]